MNIFLDTNVILSFYHLSSDDLEELKKLAVLARQGKVNLIIPEQVKDEFRRNREGKIADALKRLREQRTALQLPQIARQYEEYEKLEKAQKQLEKAHKQLIAHIEEDALTRSLEADSVIEELFQVAGEFPITAKDVKLAQLRSGIGNPPGKKGSLGDAIIWEALLRHSPKNQDLFFITDDSDYNSPLEPDTIDRYLAEEWTRTKNSKICFYTRLSAFFRDHFPDIELATELEKDILIRELANSWSFAQSHAAISKLSQYSDFTDTQVNEIVTAAITNNQIYWIARDPDVHAFLSAIVQGRQDMIEPADLPKIRYLIDGI
jgi:predicted nucleic acid-binding protein